MLATAAAFVIGALCLKRDLKTALILLLLGIVCRSVWELLFSMIRSSDGFETALSGLTNLIVLFLYYICTFILPFMLFFDALRVFRRSANSRPTAEPGEQAEDANPDHVSS